MGGPAGLESAGDLFGLEFQVDVGSGEGGEPGGAEERGRAETEADPTEGVPAVGRESEGVSGVRGQVGPVLGEGEDFGGHRPSLVMETGGEYRGGGRGRKVDVGGRVGRLHVGIQYKDPGTEDSM